MIANLCTEALPLATATAADSMTRFCEALVTPSESNVRAAFTGLAEYAETLGANHAARAHVARQAKTLLELALSHGVLITPFPCQQAGADSIGYALGATGATNDRSSLLDALTADLLYPPDFDVAATALFADIQAFCSADTWVDVTSEPSSPPCHDLLPPEISARSIAVFWNAQHPLLFVKDDASPFWSYKPGDGKEACGYLWHNTGRYPVNIDDDVMTSLATGTAAFGNRERFVCYALLQSPSALPNA
ncbi:hypothetical protein [Pandoraea anhela]|uniref:Uncharacterized protein n=1 Tax=Pandoraea anhela TaxID=2508295 RepID=A0A5E4S056_9BURK|nr:hypothetical protein [Pandoraea anhela]VVD67438.1 hypothetical protein PAN31108_00433 [Pandoraea anhela]